MPSFHPWSIFPRNLGKSATRSLGLLFVLKELGEGFKALFHLQDFTTAKLQGACLSDELAEVLQRLDKFALYSVDNPFIQKGGVLDVLCFYSEILLQASATHNEAPSMALEEIRKVMLHLRYKLSAWKKTPALHPLDFILSACLEAYQELREKLRQFFYSLLPHFIESRTDENVLVYLVEQRHDLNRYLGERVIENLLTNLFPEGFSLLRTAICEGFVRRGFSSFYAQKEPLLDELEQEIEAYALPSC